MCKKLIFSIFVFCCISSLATAEPTNLLTNGGFEDGFAAPWGFDNGTPTNEIVTDAEEGTKALKVTIAAAGSNDYVPALRYENLTFESGKKYTFSVFLKGSADGMQVTLKPEQTGGSYTGYGQVNKNITTEWVEYYTTTPVFSSTVTPGDLSIWLGHQAGDVYVDNAKWYEGDYVASSDSNEPASGDIWREAESADILTPPMAIFDDDPCASGGKYIGVESGNNSTDASPAPDGTASYIFDVPETGTYKVFVRVKLATDTVDDDSSWARIDGATYSSGSGWIKWNNVSAYAGTDWSWVPIFNNDDGDAEEEFTMDAGQYTLEIAYREDGMYFDAILITDDLALDPATLPDQIPAGGCTEENILVNGSFEDGFESPWVFDNASPAYEIVDDAENGSNALKVTIAAPGSSEYIPALAQPGLSFETGKKYTFSVFLKGSYDGMQVYLKPQQRGGSYTGYGAAYVTLTTDWAEYSVTTPVFTSDVATADVSIWLGIQAGDIYIDHVRFYEGDYVAPCPPEGPAPAVVKATKPEPSNGATDLPISNLLSWKPGDYADFHNVYFGTDKQAVTDATVDDPMGVLVSQEQPDAFYAALGDYGLTYYWRVDEVNETDANDLVIYPGSVWSFSTKPIGLIIPEESITASASGEKDETQDPNNTINGSGLNDQNQHSTDKTAMWLSQSTTEPNEAWIQYNFDMLYKLPRMLIWNYNLSGLSGGYGIKGLILEYSADGGQTWTILDTLTELPKAPGEDTYEPVIVDLGGVVNGIAADAIRITAQSNWSTTIPLKQYGLSEVKFYYIPVRPTDPDPADGATGVGVTPTLTWTPGEGVVEHKVYFGTNEQKVTNGTATSYITTDASFDTPDLTLGTMYYWRVEEINNASQPSAWSGDTWSFSTEDYRVVDDFEGYTNSINKWSGGSSSSGNGAAIAPVETVIFNNGSKSMKFLYDDSSTEGYSEVSANPSQLASGKDWTTGGPSWLVFWIYGDLDNGSLEKLYVKLNDAFYWNMQDLVPISEVKTPWWTQVNVPLIPGNVNLSNVTNLRIGFIRTGSPAGSGLIYVDDIRLYKNAPTPISPVNPGDANMVARYRMENNVNDSTSHHINGTISGNPTYVSGPFSGYGKALALDGNDCVDLGSAEPFNFTGSFSISYWANIQAWTTDWAHVMMATRGEGMGFAVRRGGYYWAGRVQGVPAGGMAFTTRGIPLAGVSSFGSPEDMMVVQPKTNGWTQIVCVFDQANNVKRVYYDSKLISEKATVADSVLIPSTSNATLGARANADNTDFESYFTGMLDDVRFYNKALTAQEVRYLADPTP